MPISKSDSAVPNSRMDQTVANLIMNGTDIFHVYIKIYANLGLLSKAEIPLTEQEISKLFHLLENLTLVLTLSESKHSLSILRHPLNMLSPTSMLTLVSGV